MAYTVEQFDTTMAWLLARAGEVLGGEARPVELGWDVDRLLRKQARRVARVGLRAVPPLLVFSDARRGHDLSSGLEVRQVTTPTGPLRFVLVSLPGDCQMTDFYAVASKDLRRFYRFVRCLGRRLGKQAAPLLPPALTEALLANTLGWLKRDRERLKQYDLPQRRGVLLLGSPGNGKTMACRWLRYELLRRGLEWSSVSRQQYERAVSDGEVGELFELPSPGVVLFDDFDAGLQDRAKFGDRIQGTFLTEMDGMSPKTGVVYLFTSNLSLDDIDPAARRPGRIDTVLQFDAPTADLRRRLILERWPEEIVRALPVETVVNDTEGLSFAELEEARKLVILNYLDSGEVVWVNTHTHMASQRTLVKRRAIGFSASTSSETESVGAAALASNE